jgi:lipopolysaccharide export system permease protein
MRIITLSLLAQLSSIFLSSLFALSLLLVFVGVAKEGVSHGLGTESIIRMIPYVIPMALRVSIPLTALLAVSVVYGRMSADQEVTAVKAMGVNPWELMFPAWGFAVLVSCAAVFVNDLAVSWGRLGVQRIVLESLEEIVYRMLRTDRAYGTQRFSMHVAGVDGKRLLRPYLEFWATADAPLVRVVAREAELHLDRVSESFQVVITDGVIERGDSRVEFRDSRTIPIPLLDAMRKPDRTESPSQIALNRVGQEARLQEEKYERVRTRMVAALASQWTVGDYTSLGDGAWQGWLERMEESSTRLHRLRTEPWRRWATGFSCLFFVIAATPLSILTKTANFFTTFAACFFPILMVYYPLLAFSVDRAKDGAFPPIIVWLGNLVLGLAGLVLMRKVIRH